MKIFVIATKLCFFLLKNGLKFMNFSKLPCSSATMLPRFLQLWGGYYFSGNIHTSIPPDLQTSSPPVPQPVLPQGQPTRDPAEGEGREGQEGEGGGRGEGQAEVSRLVGDSRHGRAA